jgi:hypothetical protein
MSGDRPSIPVTPYGSTHPLLVARVRIAVGVWLLILTGMLFVRGYSGWWAVLLLPAAALHFYLAYRRLVYRNDSQGH